MTCYNLLNTTYTLMQFGHLLHHWITCSYLLFSIDCNENASIFVCPVNAIY